MPASRTPSKASSTKKATTIKRDIIPTDFFLDLYNEVDGILYKEVGKNEPRVSVLVSDSFQSNKASPKTKSPVRSNASSPGKACSPWASHPFFQAPLFAE